MKICTSCGESKLEEDFYLQKNDKRESRCKECRGKKQRNLLRVKREKINELWQNKWDNRPDNKTCTKCKKEKNIICFETAKRNKDGFLNQCRECRNRDNAPYRKISNRKRWLKSNYNLTLEQYDEMMAQQNGVCGICKKKDFRRLSIDHDRECCSGQKSCGKCVRGLLCSACNRSLGLLGDKLVSIMRVVDYLNVE